jgi:asparagine synthase (glutamine-hydrolysing)
MCGICGIFSGHALSEAQQAVVKQMTDALAHRGPDGEGVFSAPGVIFGHRRLSIIDLELGGQPMHSPDGRYSLIFNGEIYNYIELRQKLTKHGVQFRTFSDSEVLLQMLIHEGTKATMTQVNGMFAFAMIDHQTGEWLLARDPFGIKPLYYTLVNGEVVFASEIKALLLYPGVRAEVNWAAMQQYLTFQFCLGDHTLFQGIRKIEPGCFVQGRGGNMTETVRYWDTTYTIDEYHTEEYFTDKLRSLLEDAVRLQVRSDVPVGAYLSGGLDSSIVTTLTNESVINGRLKAFHGLFAEGPQYDESSCARLVAEASDCDLLTVTPSAAQFVDDLPGLIYAMDEPVAGPGLFPQYRVSKLAAQHVKVILGGQGGDEIFGGYARYLVGYLEQALKGAIFETQEEGKHIVTLESIIPNLPLLQQYRPLMQNFWKDGLFEEMDARYFRMVDRSPDVESLLSADARARFDRRAVFAEFQAVFNNPDTKSYINKMTNFDLKTLLPALLQVEDRVSMAVSLESRVPLLDTRIVDLVTTMPPPMKFQGGRTKHMLKKAVRNMLPPPILNRKDKMGFPVPLKEWMAEGPVREFVCDTLFCQASRQRGLFDSESISRLINQEAAFGRQLWGVLCLELWHQRFVDGRN